MQIQLNRGRFPLKRGRLVHQRAGRPRSNFALDLPGNISDSSGFPGSFCFDPHTMKTIYLYIFREIFKTFFFALIVFTGILVLVLVAREAVSQAIPLTIALSLFPYMIPEVLRITIPVVLLLATTTFFARMAGSNEFTALKSLGIPPWKIIWPVILTAFLASFGYIWFSEVAVPWGQKNITRILIAGAEEIIYSKLRTKHGLSDSGFEISVKGVENRRLLSPTIISKDMEVTAEWAEIKIDLPRECCVISIHNARSVGVTNFTVEDVFTTSIPLTSLIPTSSAGSRPSEMPLEKIAGQIEMVQEEKKAIQNRVAAQTAFAVCFGNFEEFSQPVWQQSTQNMEERRNKLNRLTIEPQRRFAAGFSCLAFVWIGTTLAIWSKKADIFASFFACFIPILILYYPLLMLGTEWGKSGITPPVFIWSGNLFIVAVGYWFYKKIHRY